MAGPRFGRGLASGPVARGHAQSGDAAFTPLSGIRTATAHWAAAGRVCSAAGIQVGGGDPRNPHSRAAAPVTAASTAACIQQHMRRGVVGMVVIAVSFVLTS